MAENPLPYILRPGQPTCGTCRFAQVLRVDAFGPGQDYLDCRYEPPHPKHGSPTYNSTLGWCGKHEALA